MTYIDRLFNFSGKVAAVTGGAGFLCGEMALALHHAGCNIAILDNNMENAKKIAKKISDDGGQALPLEIDVTNKREFENCLNKILEKFGKVDLLINGAGINSPTAFLDITEKEWDEILAVQLKGTMFGCQVFGKEMLNQGKGSIINISSASADPPLSKAFTYSVSKAGIKNLTKNLAREWAMKGVRVNALRPGFFPTDWNKKHFITAEREQAILGHTPMARYGKPEELVGAVLWLASDSASFVTGSEVTVDGGFSAMTI